MADIQTQIDIQINAANAASTVGELKKSIRELESIAIATGDENSAAFLKATQAAGQLRDRIEDTKDAIKTFKGDPIENLSKGVGSLKNKLVDLDFKGFSDEVNRLKGVSKQVTFKELSSSVGDTAKSFANLGKILLTNPLFLLASVIALVVSNFDKLAEAGGVIGAVFSGIGDAIGYVVDLLKQLSDLIGLTDFEGQEKAQNTLDNAKKEQTAIEERYDTEIKYAQAAGKETTQLELQKQKEIRDSIALQIQQINLLKQSQGKLTEEQQKKYDDLLKSYRDSVVETNVITLEAQKKAKDESDKITKDNQDKADKDEKERQDKAKQRAQKIKEEQKSVTDFLTSEEEKRYQNTLTDQGRELRQADLKREELVKKANGNAQILSEVEENYNITRHQIIDKYDKLETKKEQEQADNLLKVQKEVLNERLNEEEQIQEEIYQASLTPQEKELSNLRDSYFEKIQLAEQYGLDASSITEQYLKKESEINDKYRKDEEEKELQDKIKRIDSAKDTADKISSFAQSVADISNVIGEIKINKLQEQTDRELSILDNQQAKELNNKNLTEEQRQKIEEKYEKKKYDLQVSLVKAKNKLDEKAFKTNKALNLATAIIDGVASVVKTLAGTPYPANIPLGIAAGVAAAAQIAKIAATKFTPESLPSSPDFSISEGSVGGGGSQPSFTPPTFFGLGNGVLQQGGQQNTQQVVVLENDITTTQNRVRVIENRSVIG